MAESQVHFIKKEQSELGDKLDEATTNQINEAVKAVEDTLTSDNVDTIRESLNKLGDAMKVLMDKKGELEEQVSSATPPKDGETVDANFKEV
jgi:predicted  nucleic acid-binding Zn-ribbon protein